MNIQLFICFHKAYPFIKNSLLKPLWVGNAVKFAQLPFLADNDGCEISQKNPFFCELTATYWISKNVSADIVGLFHYRRYLNFKNEETSCWGISEAIANKYGINANTLTELFKNYDVVLPKRTREEKVSMYDYYCQKHVKADIDCVLDVISEKYPQMFSIAYDVLHNQKNMYPCNMIVAKKDIFDQYANWLFDILFEVEKRIQSEVLKRETYQQRVYGFLAERMTGIFFKAHPEFLIKEVPMLYIEDNRKQWIKYLIRTRVRKAFRSVINLGSKLLANIHKK